MPSKFSLEAILSLTDNLTGPYRNTTRRISGMNNTLNRSFGTLNRGINRGLRTVATIGLASLGAGLAIATREFINLDESITQAGAKFKDLDTTSADYQDTLRQLSMAARTVGSDTEFSATDAAGALDKMAMAGLSSAQSMALLRGTTDLATAAGTDLTTAVDIATDSLGAFNLMTEDTIQLQENLARVSDVMAKTTTTANTSLEEMFEAVRSGAPAFTAAGQGIEEFAALTGILANSGLKGSEAGTALRNIMLRLAKPTGEASDTLESLGVQTQDAEGNFRNVIDIIGDFEKGLRGMGTAQRTAALTTVFGARSVTGMNVLLAEGVDNLSDYRDTLLDSAGASRTMAEAMRQSIGNRLKVLKSGLTEIGLKFIDAFQDKGRGALDALIQRVQDFDMAPIIDGAQKMFDFIEKWGPAVINMAPTLLAIAAGIKAWSIAQGLLNAGLLTGPIGAFIVSVTALLVLLGKLEKAFGTGETGTVFSEQFETGRRERLEGRQEERRMEDPRFQRQATQKAQEAEIERNVAMEEMAQRHDIFLHAPAGTGVSTTPGGAPEQAVSLGAQ